VIARTLSRRITLATASAEAFSALRFLECDPEIIGPQPEELKISIERHRSYYRIVQNGKLLREQMTTKSVVESLHTHLIILSLADFPAAPLLRAASLRRSGRRVLLVGPKGEGKTTLALCLLQNGYEIEGDEDVFVTLEGVVARPCGLRVKESADELVPGLAQMLAAAAFYQDTHGRRIYNLDPRRVGATTWRIERGGADAVILLRSNHGGYSSYRRISSLTLVREAMAECKLSRGDRAKAVSAIAKQIGTAKGFDLSLGDPAGAVACVNKLLEELA
jgi:energy-coupling factor transporter ATP-binding protein EcfA2